MSTEKRVVSVERPAMIQLFQPTANVNHGNVHSLTKGIMQEVDLKPSGILPQYFFNNILHKDVEIWNAELLKKRKQGCKIIPEKKLFCNPAFYSGQNRRQKVRI